MSLYYLIINNDNPEALHFGYTCACGERVVVFTFEIGVTSVLPDQVSIACKNGHATTFTAKQYGLLPGSVE